MSHFTTITVHKQGQDPEELLAPFTESVERDSKYAVFKDTEDEDLKEYQTKGRNTFYGVRIDHITKEQYNLFKKTGYLKLARHEISPMDAFPESNMVMRINYWVKGKGYHKDLYGVAHDIQKYEEQRPYTNGLKGMFTHKFATLELLRVPAPKQIPYVNIYPTFEAYQKDFCESVRDPDKNRYGYWHNPNAKWDWYEMGGRWTGAFKAKQGTPVVLGRPGVFKNTPEEGFVDQIAYKDIDFVGMEKAHKAKGEQYWQEYQDKLKDPQKSSMVHFEYDIKPGMSKKQYMKKWTGDLNWMPFAFVDKNGNWHEKGEMGWWGIVSNEDKVSYEEAFKRFVATLEPDDILTQWDLHI